MNLPLQDNRAGRRRALALYRRQNNIRYLEKERERTTHASILTIHQELGMETRAKRKELRALMAPVYS